MARSISFIAFAAAGGLFAAEAAAQEAPRREVLPDITILGQRPIPAEAPRSTACEVLARDGFANAVVTAAGGDLFPYAPVRLPRSPDYSAPPSVPEGSALPELGKRRFGVGGTAVDGVSSRANNDSETVAGTAPMEDRIAACRAALQRGGARLVSQEDIDFPDAFSPASRASGRDTGFALSRSQQANRDRSLPMGLALFDQGRYREALDYFRQAERKLQPRDGGEEATLYIGKILLQGLGPQSDPQEGVRWLKKAATLPFSPVSDTPQFDPRYPEMTTAMGEASIMLANIYLIGFRGIPRDLAESRRWLERAWDVGHIGAGKALGDVYLNGTGVAPDAARAAQYYEKAAKFDHPDAQVALAQLLLSGAEGVPANPAKAINWLKLAARNDNADALFALGRAHEFGTAMPADIQRAALFYKEAALGGNAQAQNALGTMFYEGTVLPKDLKAARQWFDAAAQRGDADAMFNLAAMLARGQGGPSDMGGARKWLKAAQVAGHDNAGAALAELDRRAAAKPQG